MDTKSLYIGKGYFGKDRLKEAIDCFKEAYKKLQVGYHFSEWSGRAYPYWLLP